MSSLKSLPPFHFAFPHGGEQCHVKCTFESCPGLTVKHCQCETVLRTPWLSLVACPMFWCTNVVIVVVIVTCPMCQLVLPNVTHCWCYVFWYLRWMAMSGLQASAATHNVAAKLISQIVSMSTSSSCCFLSLQVQRTGPTWPTMMEYNDFFTDIQFWFWFWLKFVLLIYPSSCSQGQ